MLAAGEGAADEKIVVDQELAEDSPYPEVRAAVAPTDDPDMPCVCLPFGALLSSEYHPDVDNCLDFHDLGIGRQHALVHASTQYCHHGHRRPASVIPPRPSMGKIHAREEVHHLWLYLVIESWPLQYQGTHPHCPCLERQLRRRCRLRHRHPPRTESLLRSKFRWRIRMLARHLNSMYRLLLCRSHATLLGLASGNDVAHDSYQRHSVSHFVPR